MTVQRVIRFWLRASIENAVIVIVLMVLYALTRHPSQLEMNSAILGFLTGCLIVDGLKFCWRFLLKGGHDEETV